MQPSPISPAPAASPAPKPPARSRLRRVLKWIAITLGSLLVLLLLAVAAGGLWLRSRIAASLPPLEGERAVANLGAAVEIERDAAGIPTLRAASRADVARGLGFVHAQDRFFQMDRLRRRSAGNLSELLGPATLKTDREIRVHGLGAVARQAFAAADPAERALAQAYAEGVNAGLASLEHKPFEYIVLGAEPAPWRPEDCYLVLLSMFIELQDEKGEHESMLGVLRDTLPPAMFAFLAPPGTEWDAPLEGGPLPEAPLPGPEVFDLRSAQPLAASHRPATPPSSPAIPGSNSWAVGPGRSARGGAILANDIHLPLGVPNLWYRAAFEWPAAPGSQERHRVTGATLPGTFPMAVGSNGRVAWSLTNSRADISDLVVVETDSADPDSYRTPAGPRKFEHRKESIQIKGRAPESLEVLGTVWGPVIDKDYQGRPRALRWVAHEPRAVNFSLMGIETAGSAQEALAVAHRSGIPAQNLVVADAQGTIAWTIAGSLPRRRGFDGRLPASWASGDQGWDGWLQGEEIPVVMNAPEACLWTANNRLVDAGDLARIGDGGYALGVRARQIRDRVCRMEKATEEGMLAVQLDDRALLLDRWRKLMLDTLTDAAVAGHPKRAELRKLVADWNGKAEAGSAGYRLVRTFRFVLAKEVFDALTARGKQADPEFDYFQDHQFESPLWRLVRERPAHLLSPKLKTWDDQLLAAVDLTIDNPQDANVPLAERTWGALNKAAIQHSFSRVAPFLSGWLDMPAVPLSGDADVPHVQLPNFGASLRMVVSPGREAQGLFVMPGGQSGHPMSPHYRDAHDAWLHGKPAPFLPGPPVHRLRLVAAQ